MKYINKSRLSIVFLILLMIFVFTLSYAQSTAKSIKNSVVRLHILANSDSASDQSLKLAVRNKIISESSHIFDGTQSPYDALSTARENADTIRRIAEQEIAAHGYTYKVRVEIGEFPFPTKAYDGLVLPSGRYNAVRVSIGEGKGTNWWCVMYPPLCFTKETATVPSSSREKLKNSLSKSDYELISEYQSGKIPVNIRFKIVELLGR